MKPIISFLILIQFSFYASAISSVGASIFCVNTVKSNPLKNDTNDSTSKNKRKRKPFLVDELEVRDDVTVPWTNHVLESDSNVQGFVKTTRRPGVREGLEMYFRIDYPKVKNKKPWIWLQHGLGDHSGQVNELTSKYLEKGYVVIRTDLLGHARTLNKTKEKFDIDEPTSMTEQAHALLEVAIQARKFGLRQVKLVGHSLGGAALLKLNSLLQSRTGKGLGIDVESIDLISFYAQDLGDWIYSQALLGRPVSESINQVAKFMSPRPIGEALENNFQQGYYFFSQFYSFFQAMVGYTGLSRINENLTWPQLSKFMYSSYEPYFKAYSQKNGIDITSPEVKKWLDEQIRSAIAVTKGARNFNLFHINEDMPHSAIPIHIIAGGRDELVPSAMMKQAALRFQDSGSKVRFSEIPNAGHLMTRENVEEVFKELNGE